ncbi:MAG TPA: hypothetical protein VNN79_14380 [Actinomycetota bacterium]|nr:hypothetical protein [Actinomycetota bacterium]
MPDGHRAGGEPEPVSLAGVEQEYRVLLDGQPVDFRWVIGSLPIDGRRLDPGDPLALRCAWGGVVTADDAEAEIAIPPVSVGDGWASAVVGLLHVGQEELVRALPPQFVLEGYSTHLSFAMPDRVNDRVCRDLVRRFAPALLLLTAHGETPGILVRPRPGRTELGLDHVDGDLLRAAATFAAGAARTCAAAASGNRSAARLLPPSVRTEVEPAIRRYGFYVDRSAFGEDVVRDGRDTRLRRRVAGSVSGQDMLESAWAAARAGLVGADAADVELLDAMVMGRAPLPTEGALAGAHEPASAGPATSPFGEALRPYRGAAVDVRAQFVTWDFVVFEARTGGRRAYVNIPRDGLEPFLGALHRGHVDPVIRDFVSAERQTPIVLSDHSQTREPGLYDGVGDPAALVPPEREPGGRGGASVPGGRRSKQRSRRAERPRPVAAAAKRPRRAILVGAIVLALVVAGIGAAALAGGGGDPSAAVGPGGSPSVVGSVAPGSPSPPVGASPSTAPSASPSTSASTSPTSTPNPSPSETIEPPTALSGVYGVTVTVAELAPPVTDVHIGDSSRGNWILSTDCAVRPCSLHLIGAGRTGGKIDATGPFQGRSVHGDAASGLFCQDDATGEHLFDFEQTRGDFSVRVSDVRRVDGIPEAVAFKGAFHFTWVPPAGQSTPGCQRTDETDTVTGTLREPRQPDPLPAGAPTPPVAQAAVVGTWDSTFHVVKAQNIGDKDRGQDLPRVLSFLPACKAATGCPLTLVREHGTGVAQDKLEPGPDGTYVEHLDGSFDCGDGTSDYRQTISLKVDDAQLVAGVWRATGLSGTYEFDSTPRPGTKGCRPQHELDRIAATAQI